MKKRGGVAICLKNNLTCRSLDMSGLSVEQHCEVAGMLLGDFSMQLISLYRSPSGDFDRFLVILNSVFEVLDSSLPTIISGDFNVHYEREQDGQVTALGNLFLSYGLVPLVNFNTRQCAIAQIMRGAM